MEKNPCAAFFGGYCKWHKLQNKKKLEQLVKARHDVATIEDDTIKKIE
jgi:hypothetical protein